MSRAVRIPAIGVAIVMVTAVAAVATAASPTTSAPTTSAVTSSTAAVTTTLVIAADPSPATEDEVVAAFATAGVTITPIGAPVPGDGMTLTDWQAANLARQASVGAGMTGAQLREAFPVGDRGVPIDAIVAAWLIRQQTESATAARSIMPIDVETITDPAPVVYPWAVLVLFVHDLMSASPGSDAGPSGLRGEPRPAPVAASGGGVCAALSDFYTGMKAAVIDGLKEVPVVGTLAEWAIALFEQILGTVLDPLLAPVKAAIGALGVAAAVANLVDPWTFYIDEEPFGVIAYGIAPNPGNAGSFTARIVGGAILEWPPALEECANLANVQLPDLDPNGAAVTWTTSFGPHATVTSQDDTIFDDQGEYVARLEYVTAVEPAEYATGALLSATITMSATVIRPPSQQLEAIVTQIVGNALSSLPADVAQILGSLAGSVIGSIVKFNDPSDTSWISVQYHAPPPTTTTGPTTVPPTTAAPPSCVGRVMQGHGQLQGITLELRPNGTWSLDFTGYPTQEVNGVVVTLAGEMVGTWTPLADGTGYQVVTDVNSPFTATGTFEGITLTFTHEELVMLLGWGFGAGQPGGGVMRCINGDVATAAGEIVFS